MRYVHTNIISNDWQKLADFYINTFQCKIILPERNQSGDWLSKGTGVKNAQLEGVHLLLPGHGENGPTLEIYQYKESLQQDPIQPNTRGFAHIAFEVDNVEKVLKNLLSNGGSKCGDISEKQIENIGKITFVYARDPEGNLIEIQNWERIQNQ